MGLSIPLGDSLLVPVVLENPISRKRYPERGEMIAVVDTGYTGFTLVPEHVYRELGLSLLEPHRSTARTADGRIVELRGSYAVVKIPGTGLSWEGLVETAPSIEEILLGTRWLRDLYLTLDGCTGTAVLEGCR